jgi:uncharacterized protein YjbI with pentapeptide repeats
MINTPLSLQKKYKYVPRVTKVSNIFILIFDLLGNLHFQENQIQAGTLQTQAMAVQTPTGVKLFDLPIDILAFILDMLFFQDNNQDPLNALIAFGKGFAKNYTTHLVNSKLKRDPNLDFSSYLAKFYELSSCPNTNKSIMNTIDQLTICRSIIAPRYAKIDQLKLNQLILKTIEAGIHFAKTGRTDLFILTYRCLRELCDEHTTKNHPLEDNDILGSLLIKKWLNAPADQKDLYLIYSILTCGNARQIIALRGYNALRQKAIRVFGANSFGFISFEFALYQFWSEYTSFDEFYTLHSQLHPEGLQGKLILNFKNYTDLNVVKLNNFFNIIKDKRFKGSFVTDGIFLPGNPKNPLKLFTNIFNSLNYSCLEHVILVPNNRVCLKGSYLPAAFLQKTNLKDADLSFTDLTNADLSETKLNGANLTCANLTNASLTCANLTCANLTDAILVRTDLRKTVLSGANLTGANLTNANLAHIFSTNAILTGANLSRAYLAGANFTNAILTDANLTGANLTGAILTDAILVDTILVDAILTGAILKGVILKVANLSRAYLAGANLMEASFDLTDANLTRASILAGNNSWGDNGDILRYFSSNAALTSANLTGASLTRANIVEDITWGGNIVRHLNNQAAPVTITTSTSTSAITTSCTTATPATTLGSDFLDLVNMFAQDWKNSGSSKKLYFKYRIQQGQNILDKLHSRDISQIKKATTVNELKAAYVNSQLKAAIDVTGCIHNTSNGSPRGLVEKILLCLTVPSFWF